MFLSSQNPTNTEDSSEKTASYSPERNESDTQHYFASNTEKVFEKDRLRLNRAGQDLLGEIERYL